VISVVTPGQAHERGDAVHVLDVREPEEWDAGHVEGSMHIPLMQLPARLAEVPRDRPLIAVCRVGARSASATMFLERYGYQVANLDGGLEAWAADGLPLVAGDGQPGVVI
jgi:rhodanese-related sulfurtransferase